jgi:hypothetical protein
MFQLVNDFFDKNINIDRLNFGVVTLVPKGADADKIQKYGPICLLNVIFKIITKMIVNRLIKVIWKVIKITEWEERYCKRKYHLVNWKTVCLPKDHGGLGVLDLEVMNIALLSKWLWKLFNEKGFWQTILENKYLKNTTMGQCTQKVGDSHLWQGLMEVKPLFLSCCNLKVGMGTKTRFWEDTWITDPCLASYFPRLYAISNDHNITVQKACPPTLNSLSFRRTLVGERLIEWNK